MTRVSSFLSSNFSLRTSNLLVAALLAISVSACADTLPAQDRRISNEVAIAKMSTDDLWKDFQADAAAARAKYWGKAVEVSGKPTRADGQDSGGAYLLFAQAGELGVRANLLDDDAAAIVKTAGEGGRITLKCYCDGLDGNLILRSCVRP
jgi:hypothetical protein